LLDEAGLPGELRLRQGLALVAMVGRASPVTAALPPFLAAAERPGGIHLAVGRGHQPGCRAARGANGKPDSGSAPVLFRAEKRIGLVLFGKGNIGSRWLELFAREQSAFGVPGLNFSQGWWTAAAAC
jgi:aspartokinase/homoserine dehydrogenase 2